MVAGDPAEQRRTVARALEAGITYFDTAPDYGTGRSEENLGRVLTELGAWGRVVVGTKVRLTPDDLADPVAAIRRSCEASLRRLGHDAVDLMQLHNAVGPSPTGSNAVDADLILGDVVVGLRRLVEAGLARHIGFTGMGGTAALHRVAGSGALATMQSFFNALNPSAGYAGHTGGGQDFAGLIDVAASAGVGVIVIRPLAAGALSLATQRHPNAGNPGGSSMGGTSYAQDLARAQAVAALAAELGLDGSLELAMRFVLSKPGVSTMLVGYSDLAQLEAAIGWAERGPLPAGAVERVLALAAPPA
jgi:L-galactose dehydrogenase/L-glyceraldehyde 3-phosphate reductase